MHEAAKDVSFAAVMFDCTFIREAIADLKLLVGLSVFKQEEQQLI